MLYITPLTSKRERRPPLLIRRKDLWPDVQDYFMNIHQSSEPPAAESSSVLQIESALLPGLPYSEWVELSKTYSH
jgi:hypothetical protein